MLIQCLSGNRTPGSRLYSDFWIPPFASIHCYVTALLPHLAKISIGYAILNKLSACCQPAV